MLQIPIFIFLSFIFGLFQVEQPIAVLPEISCKNIIVISGTTNINSFECYYPFKDEQLIVLHNREGEPYPDSMLHQIILPLENFVLDNEFMKTDFLELMKSDSYPDLLIGIYQKDLAGLNQNSNNLNVKVSMAGVTRVLVVLCFKRCFSNGKVHLIGSKQIKLSDFGIIPHNYFGFIKIRNDIFINFELNISQ